jgi:hypothetical protein
LARGPDPWQPPDWALAGPDRTFGNRFDDPEGAYRVLYASSQRLGCYLETLARFRVDPPLRAELAEIAGEDDFTQPGHVPPEWAETRMLGSAAQHGSYVDLYSDEWIAMLRRLLAADCVQLGIAELNADDLRQGGHRALTQRASRLVYDRAFDGVRYLSRYGRHICNWALFEPFKIDPKGATPLDLGDPELREALAIHGLQLGG